VVAPITCPFATTATPGPRHSASLELDHAEPGWVAARVVGGPSAVNPNLPVFAHTSPVVVGHPQPHPTAVEALRRCVEQTREWVETQGQFTSDKRKAQHLERCDQALAKLSGGGA
jgi:hypothetical protein